MTKVAIVYHSGYGHTEVQAKHVHKGAAAVAGVTATLVKAEEATADITILQEADAIIFGTPTYMGSASAPFKAFMDASAGTWFTRKWQNKIAAGFTNSQSMSGDKFNTLMQLNVFAMQHGMIWVGQGELNQSPAGEPGKADAINRMGSFLGAMAQSENAAPDITPPSGDLKTAELLGQRVAEITKKLAA